MLNLLDKQRVQKLAETMRRVGWPRIRALKIALKTVKLSNVRPDYEEAEIGVLYFDDDCGPNDSTNIIHTRRK